MLIKKRRSLVAIMLSLFAFAFAAIAAPTAPIIPVDFSLRSVDGGEISSDMLRGDVVVLAIGASWLPLSRDQIGGVQKLADNYADRDVRVFWVSTESESPKSRNYATDSQLRSFARKNGLKVAVLRDPDGVVSKRMGVDQLPAIVILDQEGNVYGSPIGGLDPDGNLADRLAPKLDKLLAKSASGAPKR